MLIGLIALSSCRTEYTNVSVEVTYRNGDIDTLHIDKVLSMDDKYNSIHFSDGCLSYRTEKSCWRKCVETIACDVRKYRVL